MTKTRLGAYLGAVCWLLLSFVVAQADSVQTIDLPANDLVYDAITKKIYVSLPSGTPNNRGNSITVVDPFTGAIGASVFIGSEPHPLALSDDGRYLYVGLNGAGAVRRFDIATLSAGLQFPLGRDQFTGTFYAEDIEVQPGNANVIAVARRNAGYSPRHEGVAIFENGVQRTSTTPGHTGSNVIEWGATPERLYGLNNESSEYGFRRMNVTSGGVTEVDNKMTAIYGFNATMRFANGEIYATDGNVIEAESSALRGSFPSIPFARSVCPDAARGRVAFLLDQRLVVCDRPTWRYVGEMAIPDSGGYSRLVRWGEDGLAWIGGGKLRLARTSLLTAPLPNISPVPVNPEVNGLRRVDLPANDLIYDAARDEILAAVSATQNGYENTLTPIKPVTGLVGAPVLIGAAPSKLAKADDGKTVWVGLLGEGAVRRYDAQTRSAGSRFSLGTELYYGQRYPEDIAVQPGNANVVAVSVQNLHISPRHAGVAVFDNGVQLPQTTQRHTGSNVIEWSQRAERLYGLNTETTEYGFRRMQVTSSGVSVVDVRSQNSGFFSDMLFSGGRVYLTSGRVIDPESGEQLGTYGSGGQAVCVDEVAGRVFFVSGSGQGPATLTVYDRDRFIPIGSQSLSGVSGDVKSLVRWGVDGLAFISYTRFGSQSDSKIWLLRTALVAEFPRLVVQIAPGELKETAGRDAATVTISRNSHFDAALNVQIFANRPADVEVPAAYFIPAGESSVSFPISVKNNSTVEGTRLVLITARAPHWSPGTGRLTIYDDEARLTLSLTHSRFQESDGAQATTATVTRNTPTDAPLRVTLSSSDRSEATVPTVVIIPAGAASASFPVTAVNDSDYDGTQSLILSASAFGYVPARQQIQVYDDDVPSLSLSLTKPSITESDGPYAVLLTITRNAYFTDAVNVALQNDHSDTIKLPASVTIPAGARRVVVWIAAVNDSAADGEQTATLAAVAARFVPAHTQLIIKDDD